MNGANTKSIEAPCSKLQGIFDPQGIAMYSDRSLTPQQAAGNALAPGFTMSPLFETRIINVSISRDQREVYDFVSNPANLPRWASGIGTSIKNVNGEWVADTPNGPVKVRFGPRNDLGVLDHYVTIAPGVEVYAPMRVVPNGSGSELTFTLLRQPDITDQKFREDAEWVLRDLKKLKDVLERGEKQ